MPDDPMPDLDPSRPVLMVTMRRVPATSGANGGAAAKHLAEASSDM